MDDAHNRPQAGYSWVGGRSPCLIRAFLCLLELQIDCATPSFWLLWSHTVLILLQVLDHRTTPSFPNLASKELRKWPFWESQFKSTIPEHEMTSISDSFLPKLCIYIQPFSQDWSHVMLSSVWRTARAEPACVRGQCIFEALKSQQLAKRRNAILRVSLASAKLGK